MEEKEIKKWIKVMLERDNTLRDDLARLEMKVLALEEEIKKLKKGGKDGKKEI